MFMKEYLGISYQTKGIDSLKEGIKRIYEDTLSVYTKYVYINYLHKVMPAIKQCVGGPSVFFYYICT